MVAEHDQDGAEGVGGSNNPKQSPPSRVASGAVSASHDQFLAFWAELELRTWLRSNWHHRGHR